MNVLFRPDQVNRKYPKQRLHSFFYRIADILSSTWCYVASDVDIGKEVNECLHLARIDNIWFEITYNSNLYILFFLDELITVNVNPFINNWDYIEFDFNNTLYVKPIFSGTKKYKGRVGICCLTASEQFFSAISWQEQVRYQWDYVCFILDIHTKLDLNGASSLKQTTAC
jgi:hypothetical protein